MRQSDPPVRYLVGTPKGRLTRLEKHLLDQPWQEARKGVQVKLLAQDGEFYVFAQSADRVLKERAMRRRQLKWLWQRLEAGSRGNADHARATATMKKLGAARAKAPIGWRLIDITVDPASAQLCSSRSNRTRLAPRSGDAKGAICYAHQSHRRRPRDSLAILHPACRRQLKKPSKTSKGHLAHPTDLPSRGTSDRGPFHLHRLPGLLFVHHTAAPPSCAGARG